MVVPQSLCFIALPSRFETTCSSRAASPRTLGHTESTSVTTLIPREPAVTVNCDGVSTPAAEMIIWFGLSGLVGVEDELPPPHAASAAVVAASTMRRARAQ